MATQKDCPIILMTFSNDEEYSLAALGNEARGISRALADARRRGVCETLDRRDVTFDILLEELGAQQNADRIAILHYAGHADSDQLFFESDSKQASDGAVQSAGLAKFIATVKSIRCVFLNGCNTANQAQGFLDAGVDVVICTNRKVNDEQASTMAFWFYQTLANGEDLTTAFERSSAAVQAGQSPPGFLSRALSVTPPVATKPAQESESKLDWEIKYRNDEEALGGWRLPKPTLLGKAIRWATHPLTAALLIACAVIGVRGYFYSKTFLTKAGGIVKTWDDKPIAGLKISLKQSSNKADATEPSDQSGFVQFKLPYRTFRVGEKAELLTQDQNRIVLKPEGEFVLGAKGGLPKLLLAQDDEIPTIAIKRPDLVAGNYQYEFQHNSLHQEADFEEYRGEEVKSSDDLVQRTAAKLHTQRDVIQLALKNSADELAEETDPETQAKRKLLLFDFSGAAKDYQGLANDSTSPEERSKFFELSGDAYFSGQEFGLAHAQYKQASSTTDLSETTPSQMELRLKSANANRRSLNESVQDASDYERLLSDLESLADRALQTKHENLWIQSKLAAVQVRLDVLQIFGHKKFGKFVAENAKEVQSLSKRIDPHFDAQWWALLQHTQASALTSAAKRGGKNAFGDLQDALACLDQANEVWSQKLHPTRWANLQSHRGLIYKLQAKFADDGELPRDYLKKSIDAHKLAMNVKTEEANPLGWASCQCSLADTLDQMANSDSENESEYRDQAIKTYLRAIEKMPDGSRRCIDAKNNLANAYRKSGDRKTGDQALDLYGKSEALYSGIYKYFDPDKHPVDWETNQLNHAVVLDAIAKRKRPSEGIPLFDRAVKIKREFAERTDREAAPLAWARAHLNLASAITDRAFRQQQSSRHADLLEAIDLLTRAEEAYQDGKAKMDAAYMASQRGWTRIWLARDLYEFDQQEDARAQLKDAFEDQANCETEITIHSAKRDWFYLEGDRSLAKTLWEVYGDGEVNVDLLIKNEKRLTKAIRSCEQETYPFAWSINQHIRGRIALHIAMHTKSSDQRDEYLELAEKSFDDAAGLLNDNDSPLEAAILRFDRGRLAAYRNSLATTPTTSSPSSSTTQPSTGSSSVSAVATSTVESSEIGLSDYPAVNEWNAKPELKEDDTSQ